jgi:hypothetical protein
MRRQKNDATPLLVEIVPSRWDDDPLTRARAMLAGLVGVTGVALEYAASAGAVHFYVRADSKAVMDRVLTQLRAHYPQAELRPINMRMRPDADPLQAGSGERRAVRELRLQRAPAFPLISSGAGHPRERNRVDDPLTGVLMAGSAVGPGQRVVGQLVLAPAADAWSQRLAARYRSEHRQEMPRSAETNSTEMLPILALVVVGGLVLRGYLWHQEGQLLPLLALIAGSLFGLPLLGLVAARLVAREQPALELVREKFAAPVFAVHVRVIALGIGDERELDAAAERLAIAVHAYDHPTGNSLRSRPWRGEPQRLRVPSGLFRRRDLLSAAELAGLWHLPHLPLPALTRGRSRHLLPQMGSYDRGCRVGTSQHQQVRRVVHVPLALLFRNHLVVAKTRRGKSTLMLHIARYLMEHLAASDERLCLVVIDPHQDLAEAVLGNVPGGLEDRVVYLNLADGERPVGLNLLDTDLFPDRDRTVENIVTMLRRLWPDNWGPRMEGALRAAITSLHEANQARAPDARYTLLDVTPMLTSVAFRAEVLAQVCDLALHGWWVENYDRLARAFQQQIANPVTTKIGRFLMGEASRFLVGQPRSSFNPRALLDGGVLVVNAAVGRLGEGAAGLLGATLLNLLGLLVEEQVTLPHAQRTRVICLVDESSILGAADYPRMLSELGKYGMSVTLITQSLARLDAIDRQLRPTVFANIDGLTVFQVSADDAHDLVAELGPELAEADLTDLDDHTCYARWWSGGVRPAVFSLRVDPPPQFDGERIRAIARRSAMHFGRPAATVRAEIESILRLRQERRPEGRPHGPATQLQLWGSEAETEADLETQPTMHLNSVPPTRTRRSHARSNARKQR